MSGYVFKPTNAPVACTINWQEGYLEDGEYIDSDLGWAVVPSEDGEDAAVAAQKYDDVRSTAIVTKGVPGRVYMLSARAKTNTGRELERALVLRIAR